MGQICGVLAGELRRRGILGTQSSAGVGWATRLHGRRARWPVREYICRTRPRWGSRAGEWAVSSSSQRPQCPADVAGWRLGPVIPCILDAVSASLAASLAPEAPENAPMHQPRASPPCSLQLSYLSNSPAFGSAFRRLCWTSHFLAPTGLGPGLGRVLVFCWRRLSLLVSPPPLVARVDFCLCHSLLPALCDARPLGIGHQASGTCVIACTQAGTAAGGATCRR